MGGRRFLNESIVNQFTKTQYPGSNRRAIGFDKPVSSLNGGPTCNLVSLESYGHTGFTGTMTWVDPKNGVNYIFLSNRVYPDAENKKLLNMSTRTEIQRVIYQAIQSKKKYD
jgi:beta-N-acetylhexosaminidase